jgi:hypothetical protein
LTRIGDGSRVVDRPAFHGLRRYATSVESSTHSSGAEPTSTPPNPHNGSKIGVAAESHARERCATSARPDREREARPARAARPGRDRSRPRRDRTRDLREGSRSADGEGTAGRGDRRARPFLGACARADR